MAVFVDSRRFYALVGENAETVGGGIDNRRGLYRLPIHPETITDLLQGRYRLGVSW